MIAFCIVEDDDRGGNVLQEVHASLEDAIAAAERTWMTRDRSHGGAPYTWVRIIEQEGAEVIHEWVFEEWTQTWVSGPETGHDVTFETTRPDLPTLGELQHGGARLLSPITDATRAIILDAVTREKRAPRFGSRDEDGL